MRIISEFKDYYDSIQRLGQDQSLVYHRTRHELLGAGLRCEPCSGASRTLIGFCGTFYPAVLLDIGEAAIGAGHVLGYRARQASAYCYSLAECDAFVDGIDHEPSRLVYYNATGRPSPSEWRQSWGAHPPTRAKMASWFELTPADQPTELFAAYNTPIVVLCNHKATSSAIHINARLRVYEFQRIKDPYAAFQEIQQFLSGVLCQAMQPIPAISDEIMQEIKGFDHEYSFRKPPTKPRKAK